MSELATAGLDRPRAGPSSGAPQGGSRRRPRAAQWLLVELLGARPTVIAEGDASRRCRPLKNVLRGPALEVVASAIGEVSRTGEACSRPAASGAPGPALLAHPVHGPTGDVLGVQVLHGARADGVQPPQPVVAGWEFALDGGPLRTRWTPAFTRLYGIQVRSAEEAGVMGLADLYRRIPRPSDVARLMTGVAEARPGDLDEGTIIARRDDGELRLVRFVRRVVDVSGTLVLRGLDQDVTSTTTTGDLAISMLDIGIASAVAQASGSTCVLTDAATGHVITWISEPPADLGPGKVGGREPLFDGDQCSALRAGQPVVLQLRTGPVLVSGSFPCVGYGATAATLVVFTQLTG